LADEGVPTKEKSDELNLLTDIGEEYKALLI
jgi:hypothetical protein